MILDYFFLFLTQEHKVTLKFRGMSVPEQSPLKEEIRNPQVALEDYFKKISYKSLKIKIYTGLAKLESLSESE